MRLIDADKLIKFFPDDGEGNWTYNVTAQSYINIQPTADAVEVVRCKDCIHYYHDSLFACERCGKTLEKIKLNGFCNHGERRK